jgi:hypothetical protein
VLPTYVCRHYIRWFSRNTPFLPQIANNLKNGDNNMKGMLGQRIGGWFLTAVLYSVLNVYTVVKVYKTYYKENPI